MFMINDEGIWLICAGRGSARRWSSSRRSRRAGRTAPRTTGWPTPTRSSARSTTSASSSRASGRTTSAGTPSTPTRPGTTCFLPVVDNTRQYINVLLILLSEPKGTAPLFMDDWRPFRPKGAADWVAWAAAKVGARRPDPLPADRRHQARARRPGHAGHARRRIGSLGTVRTDHEAYFLMQNLMLTRRGAAPRRLGPRRADDPPRDAPRSGEGPPRPRLPRAQHQAGDVALQALAAGARLAARTTSASTACSRACARRTSPTWTRPSTRCIEEKFGPGRRLRRRRGLRAGLQGHGERRGATCSNAEPPPARGDRVHEGDLPLPRRDLRALPGAHRRVLPAGHLGAVLAPGDRVLRALRQPGARAPGGRGPGDLGAPLMSTQVQTASSAARARRPRSRRATSSAG